MSTQPNKYQPGQKVKVTGNINLLNMLYHRFKPGDTVKIIRHTRKIGDAYICANDTGYEQTVYARHLQPLNHD